MAQGKLKVKAKLPPNSKNKGKYRKGAPATKRANAPIKPKKQKLQEAQKLKQAITKTVNKAVEEEMRARAGKSDLKLSKGQQAAVKHNNEMASS